MIQLRHFVESDAAVLQKNQPSAGNTESIMEMIAAWESKSFHGKYFEMFAITWEQRIVGSISLYEHSKNVVSIGVDVFPEERRKGFSAEGMRLIIAIARNQGYKLIQDQVSVDNQPSIALHEKLGFETDGYVYKNSRDRKVLLYMLFL
ncbi:MAG: GNAT family N-acetyltransferase [Oscillospiraceae bacterium]|nr:GNAT family N-acetyltransferase [Oscillospiraceae bacterium]